MAKESWECGRGRGLPLWVSPCLLIEDCLLPGKIDRNSQWKRKRLICLSAHETLWRFGKVQRIPLVWKIIRTLLCRQTLTCNWKDNTLNKGITGTSKQRGRDPSVRVVSIHAVQRWPLCEGPKELSVYQRCKDCMKSSNSTDYNREVCIW